MATHLQNTLDIEALQRTLQTLDMTTALKTLTNMIPLRPDILLETAPPTHETGNKKHVRFHLVEVGYSREGFGQQKLEEKRHQHELLRHLITNTYTADNALLYHTVTLGVTGAIYNDVECCLKSLGLSAHKRNKTYTKLVHSALNQTHGMVVQRRRLECAMPGETGQRLYLVKRKRPPDKF
jgi:short subunit fatty acids transporter